MTPLALLTAAVLLSAMARRDSRRTWLLALHHGVAERPSSRLRLLSLAAGRVIGDRIGSFRRRGRMARDLPVTIELLRMALSAGLTPAQAVRSIAPLAPGSGGAALTATAQALDLGMGIDDALARAVERHREFGPLAEALEASRTLGAGIDVTLARLGSEARAELRRAAEARARTVPVRLLFPLVLCILPAFALLGIAPSLIAGLSG